MQAETQQTRQEIHELVDRLPEGELRPLLLFAQFLNLDPIARSIAADPYDDEPLTEEAERVIRASEESIARGEVLVPHAEVLKEFGL